MKKEVKKRIGYSLAQHFPKKWSIWLLLVVFTAFSCDSISAVKATDVLTTRQHYNSITTVSDLVERGRAFYEQENYPEAIQALEQALKEYRSQQDLLSETMVLSNLALIYQQLGEWNQVNTYVQEGLTKLQILDQSSQKEQILVQNLDIQGKFQLNQGKAELAAQSWQQAAKIHQKLANQTGFIRSLINQAQALQASGYYRRALQTLTQVEKSLQTQPNSLTKVVGLRSLGNALLLAGDSTKAEQKLIASLKIAKQLQSSQEISSALFSLGNLAHFQKQYTKAIDYYQQAATISPSPLQQTKAQLNQLSILLETEAWSDIPELSAKIKLVIVKLIPNRSAIYAYINYAQNLIKIQPKNPENKPLIESILNKAIAQANRLGDKQAQAYALISLGKLYELEQQWQQAQQLTQQALIIAQEINARNIAYQGQWQLGRLYKVQGEDQAAISAYRQAVETLRSLRSDLVAINPEIQFTFRESIEPIYREYVGLLLQTPNSAENNLIAAREAIDSLQLAELENFFRATCLDAQPVVIDQITDREDPTSAIIYPIVLPDRFEIILKLPQEKLRHYSTPIDNPKKVTRILERLTQSLTQRNSRETLPLAQQVYDWLIRPAENDLASSKIKTLVFVLDSPLRNIPMSVLYDGQKYLVEKYGIALTPGLQLLNPQPFAQQEFKAITAGLTEARGGFPPLRYVADELNTVQSQISEAELLLDRDFTSTAFQAKINQLPYRVIHLATHGQFSSQAENTFILTWDDRINVHQLSNLLRSSGLNRDEAIELLVLSACETLTGDKRAALGLAGVAVRAGARSTLATLWRVNDEATSLFMGQFYQELGNQTTPTTKAEAIRRAQLALLKNPRFNRPHFWAPYVLVGNWL